MQSIGQKNKNPPQNAVMLIQILVGDNVNIFSIGSLVIKCITKILSLLLGKNVIVTQQKWHTIPGLLFEQYF